MDYLATKGTGRFLRERFRFAQGGKIPGYGGGNKIPESDEEEDGEEDGWEEEEVLENEAPPYTPPPTVRNRFDELKVIREEPNPFRKESMLRRYPYPTLHCRPIDSFRRYVLSGGAHWY